MKSHLITLLILVFPMLGSAQNLYFPPVAAGTWDTLAPTQLGYCPDEIDSLYTYLEDQNSKAFILLKDGKMVLERYFGTFTEDSLWYWASATKTLVALTVGIAQEENHLSIHDSVSQILGTGWSSMSSSHEGAITVRDLLSMSSGMDDGVPDPDCWTPNCFEYLSDPGTRWSYHNGAYYLLDSILERATGMNTAQYVFQRIAQPIGMGGIYFNNNRSPIYLSNARGMARFALLLLAQGQWNGNAVMGDSSYFQEMIHPSQSLNESYGYLTWLNGQASFMLPQLQFVFPGLLNPDAPGDMFAAIGKNGQLINVVPSQNLVWIRIGNAPTSGNGLITPDLNNVIWQYINALTCSPLALEEAPETEVHCFPNPVLDYIQVRANQEIDRVELWDMAGNRMAQVDGAGASFELDTRYLPTGIYFIRISLADGRTELRKVLKH